MDADEPWSEQARTAQESASTLFVPHGHGLPVQAKGICFD
jgi:hypothetical protein